MFGTRVCLQVGVVLETAAFVGASFTTQIWHLILSQGVAFGAGMGFLFTGTVGLIPQWFRARRSLANSLGTAGSGFGGLTYSLAAHAMITTLGLAWAFRILAILAFVVNGACSFTARDRNREVAAVHQAFHGELFRRPELYLVLAWGFFSILGYIIVVFSLASYASAVGFTSTQGSIVAAIFNRECPPAISTQTPKPLAHSWGSPPIADLHTPTVSQGLGRPMIGYSSDKIGRINVAALSSLLAGLAAFFLWIFAGRHFAGAIVYALFGAFAGCIWPCIAPVAAEVVGLQLLPSAMSVTWIVMVLPATFAEVIGLSLVEPGRDGYLHVQVYTGSMFVAAFAFCKSQFWHPMMMFCQKQKQGERKRRKKKKEKTYTDDREKVWALRVWKIHTMEAAGFSGEERENDIRNPDTVQGDEHRSPGKQSLSVAFIAKACFGLIKV